MNWSGGKDSSLCLHKILEAEEYDVKYLLTSMNKSHDRVSIHGVRTVLLRMQTESIGIPLKLIELNEQPGMEEYEREMKAKVEEIKRERISCSIFGDIFLGDLRAYREEKLSASGIECVFPLWKIPTKDLINEFIDLGFKAIIVCVNEQHLDKSFCGRIIDKSFVNDLPKSVDPCGENGEYHSFVFDGPIFKNPVLFKKGEIVYRTYPTPKSPEKRNCYKEVEKEPKPYGFYFCDLSPLSF